MERLYLIYYKRIFLLVGCVLDRLTQLVEFAQVFFPYFIDGDEHDGLVPFLDYRTALGIIGVTDVAGKVEYTLSVSYRYEHTSFCVFALDKFCYAGSGYLYYAVALASESFVDGGNSAVKDFLTRHTAIFVFGNGNSTANTLSISIDRSA